MAYISCVPKAPITVAETPLFVRQAAEVWDEAEHDAFVTFIASNPEIGDVIPDTGGVRKVRWSRAGSGKRGGVRVAVARAYPSMLLTMPAARSTC